MNQEIDITTTNIDTAATLLSERLLDRTLDADETFLLLKILEATAVEGETLIFPSVQNAVPKLGARPRNSNFVIKVKTASLLSGALVLDAFLTSGFAAGGLSAAGLDLTVVKRLPTKNGSLCNFITLEGCAKSDYPVSTEQIMLSTANLVCRHSSFDCEHRKKDVCLITKSQTLKNLKAMARAKIIDLDDELVRKRKA